MGFCPLGIPQKLSSASPSLFRRWRNFQVGETCLAGLEEETDFSGGSVAMLGYDDVCNIFSLGFGIVDLVSVNKHDDVGVLFYTVMNYKIAGYKIVQALNGQIINFRVSARLYSHDFIPISKRIDSW